MKRTPSLFRLGHFAAAVLAASVGQASGLLNVGSPAPALKIQKWVKGTPVTEFQKGQTYVVEFWATWCGPCKAAMPHLSELAGKYKDKVTFVGVSVFERGENTTARVESFVKSMGDKMAYNVCTDGSAAFMAKNWLQAAGESGIPCTFVVDGQGKIAWIGHPTKLDAVLESVVAGKADFSGLAKSREKAKAGVAVDPDVSQPIVAAIDAKDYALTVQEIDRIAASNPAVAKKYEPERLRALMFTDLGRGEALAKEIVARSDTSPTAQLDLLKAGATVGSADGLPKKAYEIAIQLLTLATTVKPRDPAPGMMRMGINVQAVNSLIERTKAKAAEAK